MTPKTKFILILFLAVSFVMGALGGALGALGLNWLGVSEIKPVEIPTFKTEKIVLEESSAIIEVAKKVTPAVVSITSKRTLADIFGNLAEQKGGGTGFIITSDGLVVTNKHVVADEKASYTVFTQDGKNFDAKIKAKDPFNDLAVLKIDANSLPVVELGDSDRLEIGQQVVAVGNALGEFQNTVTTGVISAKERKIEVEDGSALEGLLQTDAAINPGNSGGPLVNLKGQVVGINTAVAAKGIAEGIGFALPINTVKTALDGVKKTGKIKRPYLGVRYLPVTKEVKEAADLSVDFGVLVYSDSPRAPAVAPAGPADKAGILKNDVITQINNERIDEKKGLSRLIQQYQPNEEVELIIIREKREFKLKVKLGEFE